MGMQIRNVVAGILDPRDPDPSIHAAARVAHATGAVLHLVHAVRGRSDGHDPLEGELLDAYAGYLRAMLGSRIEDVHLCGPIQFHALAAEAEDALLAVGEEVHADLLVVGGVPRWRAAESRLGTTTRRVLRRSGFPVLVVRAPYTTPHRILVTTDLSPASEGVFDSGLDVVEALCGAEPPSVRALLVVMEGTVPTPLPADTLTRAGWREVGAFLSARSPRGYAVEPSLRVGAAAREIVAEAAQWGADLVVLGTHGRRGTERILLGSVAESTLAGLACNALVLPPATGPADAARQAQESASMAAAGDGILSGLATP